MHHGNSKKSDRSSHLYGIYDEQTDELFKYGISGGKIGKDGMSKRMRYQVNFLNLAAGFFQYIARILVRNIPGRKEAERIEKEHIDAYKNQHGAKPRGNR
ncbi:MAG: hypothetical protein ACKVU2_16575 [Saprospiraceae bacterium]